ncbi:hypothetical protein D3C71_777950 [compost metagenome]
MFLVDPRRDVGGDLDHAAYLPVGAKHRHVTGLEPDFLAGLVQTRKGAADWFATGQVTPQFGVLLAAIKRLFAEYPVMLAAYLVDAVTHGDAKIFVGIEHDAVRREFNHRHRTADGRQLGIGLGQRTAKAFDLKQVSFVMKVKHGRITLSAVF